jgi:hypothetical protein
MLLSAAAVPAATRPTPPRPSRAPQRLGLLEVGLPCTGTSLRGSRKGMENQVGALRWRGGRASCRGSAALASPNLLPARPPARSKRASSTT